LSFSSVYAIYHQNDEVFMFLRSITRHMPEYYNVQ